ncbi:methylamine utilization protein [Motilimonas cestriensis]|uniref:Methylamine utilization protein n=1 Tax=Motilimonas cestriensis TaxID=2742685 RepID=A0ABS8W6M9_9GAMM|nr:methylamine utilization protein [Motilimonas cestriensis]MCE2594646.1 methylamine utilization protein [Motilimonas cestriensis]
MPIVSRYLVALLMATSGITFNAYAASLSVQVTDQTGQPLKDAVVELIAPQGIDVPAAVELNYKMVQQNKSFVPFVLAVPRNAVVDFPNLDATRHHVYSFSPAKTFEIKLYKGRPHAPIIFQNPGLVALGCNIHDSMQGHIYVADSSLVAVTDSKGQLHFSDINTGSYQVKLWHPWQKKHQDRETLKLTDKAVSLRFMLPINLPKPVTKPASYPNYQER